MALRTGKELRKVYEVLCPFNKDGSLKPDKELRTILASNGNFPLELQTKAFAIASAIAPGSPQIIQVSYTASKMTGNHPKSFKIPEGVKRNSLDRPVAIGAMRGAEIVDAQVQDFGAQCVFLSLDHFTSPPLAKEYARSKGYGLSKAVSWAILEEAREAMKPVFGKEVDVDKATMLTYVDYLTSDLYGEYRADFLGAVKLSKPAWAMIDTGALPPILNFATTREMTFAVRNSIENRDCMIESEFSATGQSGEEHEYEKLTGDALENFKERIILFVDYTQSEAVAYEIGMVHAAKQAEKHDPDVQRLEVVQRGLFQRFKKHVPFAQHGGTGAASLTRGLVAKNNINTQYLVDMANTFADHYEKNKEGLRAGAKDACGSGVYVKMVSALTDRCVAKMKEANTFGIVPEVMAKAGLAPFDTGEDIVHADIEGKE